MKTRTPQEQRLYDARLRFEFNAAAERAFERGVQLRMREAVQNGKHIGEISIMQEILGDAQTSIEEFEAASADELANLASQLRQRLRQRGLLQ